MSRCLALGLITAGAITLTLAGTHRRELHQGLLCEVKDSKINESSGIAPSWIRRGWYWTHNDSGDGANAFLFDLTGMVRKTITLNGAEAHDWEDMASVMLKGVPYLYFADIGDNAEKRKSVTIYRLREPREASAHLAISSFERYDCTYPDGPHNSETLLVTPNGDMQVVTKEDFGSSSIYGLMKPNGSGKYKFARLGTLTLAESNVYSHLVTGGDMATDGRVVVRTYFTAMLFPKGSANDWFKRTPLRVPMPIERQGEAVCFDLTKRRLITTSEGSPCRVSFADLP